MSKKRIIIATLFGFLSGIFCYLLGRYAAGFEINLSNFFMLLTHRTLLGFVLGISVLKWHWVWHAIIIGLIVGIPDYHFFNMISGHFASGIYFFFGAVWGLMIEFFTTIVFKAKLVSN